MKDAFGVERGDDVSKGLETKYRRFMFNREDKRHAKRFRKLAAANKGGPFNGHADQYNTPKQIERHRARYQALRLSEAKDKRRKEKRVLALMGENWKDVARDDARRSVGEYNWRDKK